MTCGMTRRSAIIGVAAAGLALPACRSSDRALDADVIVIGAGLSGLYAAMLLEEVGLDVIVVEALDRVGGRMFTLDHGDGYTEGGGQQIGASYARLLDVAANLDVPLYTVIGRGPATAYYLNGEWSDGGVEIPAFPQPFRSTPPSSVLFRILATEPGLDNDDSWLTAPPEFDIPASQFLMARGFEPEAQALVARALNANDLDSYSMLNLHRTFQLYRQSQGMGETQYVAGGSQRLPEAMAASLARPVSLSTPVTDIRLTETGCEVGTANGRIRASHAVCSLPLPALRRINGMPFPSGSALTEAVTALPYTQIMQFHMRAERPFWEADDLPPSMWTDTTLERIFADTGRDGELTGFHRGWVNGTGVDHWLDHPDTALAYLSRLSEIRPSIDGALSPLAKIDWTRNNPHAGGAYYHWAPGQAARWARKMGESIGNLHFAGEHLGLLSTGMEAAMESAERAALAIIEGTE